MLELNRTELYQMKKKAKKIYNQSCLYNWISDKQYNYSCWYEFIINFGEQQFYDLIMRWINGDKLVDFEIESKFSHNKISFFEILNFWKDDFITSVWLAVHFYNNHLDNEQIKYSPYGISNIIWGGRYA